MANTKKSKLVAASIAGLMAVGTVVALAPAAYAENAPCYGVNACKGAGDCGGKDHACAGKNACKGQGYLSLPADACTKIAGGSLTPTA